MVPVLNRMKCLGMRIEYQTNIQFNSFLLMIIEKSQRSQLSVN
mgnify:CR=1 FL=1